MYRFGLWFVIALLWAGGAAGTWAQTLGAACTGAGITSPVLDGGLLKCNGSTYVGADIYANRFTAGTTNDGLGHAFLATGDATHTGFIQFNTSSTTNLGYIGYGGTSSLNFTTVTSVPLNFYTNNAFAMTIMPGGNVGIGTNIPQGPFQVGNLTNSTWQAVGIGSMYYASPQYSTGYIGFNLAGQSNSFVTGSDTGNNGAVALFGNVFGDFRISNIPSTGAANQALTGTNIFSNVRFSFDHSGNATFAGTLTQNSDRRLKTNIKSLPGDVFEKLDLITGVTFNWKDKAKDPRQQIGVIAQDVQKAYPQLVTADNSGTLSVNYSGLVAPLIEAVKQLHADNKQLHADNDALRKEVEADHDLVFKLRHHVALNDYEQTPYTESAWHYAEEPKGWKPPSGPTATPLSMLPGASH